MFSSNVRSLFNNSNNCEFGCRSVYHTFELQETNVREEEEGLTEYTAAISAVCLFRQSLRHYWCLCSTLAYKPQCRTGPAPPLPSRSRQLGKNSLRNGGHHAAPAAIQHHHHPVLSSHDLGGEHVLLLLLLVERLHVPRLGSATTAFGRVFLFCLHRVLFLGRSGPSVLLTCGQSAHAHTPTRVLRRYKQGTRATVKRWEPCSTLRRNNNNNALCGCSVSPSAEYSRHERQQRGVSATELSFSLHASHPSSSSSRAGEWEQNFPFPRPMHSVARLVQRRSRPRGR